jgi:hypothetical protein
VWAEEIFTEIFRIIFFSSSRADQENFKYITSSILIVVSGLLKDAVTSVGLISGLIDHAESNA